MHGVRRRGGRRGEGAGGRAPLARLGDDLWRWGASPSSTHQSHTHTHTHHTTTNPPPMPPPLALAMTSGAGVPSRSVISSSWCTTLRPGKSGLPSRISAKMQPARGGAGGGAVCKCAVAGGGGGGGGHPHPQPHPIPHPLAPHTTTPTPSHAHRWTRCRWLASTLQRRSRRARGHDTSEWQHSQSRTRSEARGWGCVGWRACRGGRGWQRAAPPRAQHPPAPPHSAQPRAAPALPPTLHTRPHAPPALAHASTCGMSLKAGRASPKSQILSLQSELARMFLGFKSRWNTW